MTPLLPRRTFVVPLAVTIGGILGYFILYYDANTTQESRSYTQTPQFIVWLVLYMVLFSFYVVFAIPLWRRIREYRAYFSRFGEVIITTVLISVLASIPDIFGISNVVQFPAIKLPLVHSYIKTTINILVGYITIVIPVIINICFMFMVFRDIALKKDLSIEHIKLYVKYRDNLSFVIAIIGVDIGLAILSVAALRQSLISFKVISSDIYPPILLLTYGAFFTLLLITVYLPVYSWLHNAQKNLVETFMKMPPPGSEKWQEQYAKRKDFEQFLQLGDAPMQKFQASLGLITPLLSGIIPILLGTS